MGPLRDLDAKTGRRKKEDLFPLKENLGCVCKKKKENPSSFALKVTKTFSLIKNLRVPFPLLVNPTKHKGT